MTICRWNYAGAEGALVFCADKSKGGLWFRVVDLAVSIHAGCGGWVRCLQRGKSHQGVIWEHELPNEIEYNQEKPFFHAWQGDVGTTLPPIPEEETMD